MRTILKSFSSWARMQDTGQDGVRLVDTAITVVFTLLLAVTWAIVKP